MKVEQAHRQNAYVPLRFGSELETRWASADREELLQADISIDVINSVRNQIAVFAHRRADLYQEQGE